MLLQTSRVKCRNRNSVHHRSLFTTFQVMFLETGLADKLLAPRVWLSHEQFLMEHLVHPGVLKVSFAMFMALCPTN
jgi:hypothetical protein